MKTCTFNECSRKYCAKGFCRVHYNMWKKGEPLHPIGKPGNPHGVGRKQLNKKCSFEECENKHLAKGWCSTHYNQFFRHGFTYKANTKLRYKDNETCLVINCQKPPLSRGYCLKHYQQWRTHGTVEYKKEQKICNIDNCDNFARAKGLCSKHYGRLIRTGDPIASYRRPRKSEYFCIDNIMKEQGIYSKRDESEALKEHFRDVYENVELDNYY